MPWLLQHKCNMTAPFTNYGLVKAQDENSHPITIMVCEGCREQMIVYGWDAFGEAQPQVPGMPPGFVIPRSSTPT